MGFSCIFQPPPFFTGSRREIFLAVADRVVPDEGPAAPGAKSDATLAAAEVFVASQDDSSRRKLGMLLQVFEWAALLRFGRRFTRLSPRKQDAYLRAWERAPVRLFRFGFSSLRNLVLVSFYTRPESWPMIHYPGPVLESKAAEP